MGRRYFINFGSAEGINVKKILLIITALCCILLLSSCGKRVVTYSTEDYVSITVSGANGDGRASVSGGTREFYKKINNDLFDGEATDLELAAMEIHIYDSVKYEIDGDKTGLSNGDKIKVTMTADNERLKALGLKFRLNEYTYTVKGLEEPKTLDIWDGVSVTYEGISSSGSAAVEYTGNDEFIKSNVRYYIDKSYGLSNGDMITVKAMCSQSRLDENLYVIKDMEKSYTVEGLPYYAQDISGFDLSEIDRQLSEAAKKTADSSTWAEAYRDKSYLYGFTIMRDGSVSAEWNVTGEYTIKPVKKIFYGSCSHYSDLVNSYTVYYEIKFPCEKGVNYSRDSYSVGDTYELTVYAEAHLNNILISDGKLDISSAEQGSRHFGRDLLKNYIGLSLEETISAHEDNCRYTDSVKIEIE